MMRALRRATDRACTQRFVRALRLALAAGALVLFWVPAFARDGAGPFSTLPPPSPSAGSSGPRGGVRLFAGDDVRVSQSPEEALAEVTLDVNPLNPANLAICGYARDLKTMSTFHSFDAGRTWAYVPVGHAHDGLGPDIDRFDPTLIFDARGFLYVGYGARVPAGNGFNDHVVVCRSADGGRTFGPGVFVWIAPSVGGNAGNDKFHLAAGPERFDASVEVVCMAWTWNIRPEFGIVDQQIAFSRSVDAGLTFSPPVVVNDDSFLDRDFAIFVDPGIGPDGVVYVVWNDLNTNDLRVDHSFDNAVTWGRDVILETETIPFRARIPPQPNRGVFAGPVLDVDRSGGAHHGRVYVVYCHGTIHDTDVLVRYSDDNANTWSAPARVNDDPPGSFQFLPWLDVNQTSGRVNVVFYDTREDSLNHRSRVYLAASDDGSGSFLRNVPVADEPSNNGVSNPARYPGNFLEYIGVAGWGDDAFVAWTDTRNAPTPLTDYYFDRVTGDEQPPEVSVTLDRDVLWPPDGRWEEVRAEVMISGGSEPNPSFVLHSVTHDEGPAGGDVLDADAGTPDLSFRLRAARRGKGDGRVYTVVYRAAGAWGGIARDSAFVFVPHDGSRALRAAPRGGDGAVPVARIRSVEPNPFHGSAVIRYETRAPGRVRLTAYDVRGREVAVLVDEYRPAGQHTVAWDGRGIGSGWSDSRVASGVYLLRMESSGVRSTRRVILLH